MSEVQRDLPANGSASRARPCSIAVLLLAMLGVIGLASMETVTRDRQVAGFQNRGRVALYAAEAGRLPRDRHHPRRTRRCSRPGGEGALESFDPAFPGKGATAVRDARRRLPGARLAQLPDGPERPGPHRRWPPRRRPSVTWAAASSAPAGS